MARTVSMFLLFAFLCFAFSAVLRPRRRLRARTHAALFWIGASVFASGVSLAAETLPPLLERAARFWQTTPERAVVIVRDAETGEEKLAWNADLVHRPASTLKIVTTRTALDLLGPDHRWTTTLYAEPATETDRARYSGDLWLVGAGDPDFSVQDLEALVLLLREAGFSELTGDLILDRSRFSIGARKKSLIRGHHVRPYTIEGDALLLSDQSLRITFTPDELAGVATVDVTPHLPGIDWQATVPLRKGRCIDWRPGLRMRVHTDMSKDTVRIGFRGGFPSDCGVESFEEVFFSADDFWGVLFRSLWEEAGGTWTGTVKRGRLPADRPLEVAASRTSEPLSERIVSLTKDSLNAPAETLFVNLAAAHDSPPPYTFAAAETNLLTHWRDAGLDLTGVDVGRGSGYSPDTRVTGRFMGDFLVAAYARPDRDTWLRSFPVWGVDGTLRHRHIEEMPELDARLKTGTLSGIRSLAGYVRAQNGRVYAVYAAVRGQSDIPGSAAFLENVLLWTATLP